MDTKKVLTPIPIPMPMPMPMLMPIPMPIPIPIPYYTPQKPNFFPLYITYISYLTWYNLS